MKTFKSLPGAHVVLTKMLQVWCYVWFPSQPSQDVRVGQTYETIHQKTKKKVLQLNVLQLTGKHIFPPGCAHFKG